jgi:tRNA(Ile2) C34 agmatinyltransferase TiaS
MTDGQTFEIAGKELATLYADLKCDSCGRRLADAKDETWTKFTCGYFCAQCVAEGRHLTHPMACRVS